jgi:hypothetical protein
MAKTILVIAISIILLIIAFNTGYEVALWRSK